jgi:hypothetical protein
MLTTLDRPAAISSAFRGCSRQGTGVAGDARPRPSFASFPQGRRFFGNEGLRWPFFRHPRTNLPPVRPSPESFPPLRIFQERCVSRRTAHLFVRFADRTLTCSAFQCFCDETIGRGEVEKDVDRHQEQPHFASASCRQQASVLTGAGPPQHPSLSLETASGRLQTPVSGSTSSTRSAASLSPAMSAMIERTCS